MKPHSELKPLSHIASRANSFPPRATIDQLEPLLRQAGLTPAPKPIRAFFQRRADLLGRTGEVSSKRPWR